MTFVFSGAMSMPLSVTENTHSSPSLLSAYLNYRGVAVAVKLDGIPNQVLKNTCLQLDWTGHHHR